MIKIFGNMIKAREARIQKQIKQCMQEMRRCFLEIEFLFAFAMLELVEKFLKLINSMAMAGDKVGFRDNDIDFTWVCRAVYSIKKRDMYGEKEAIIIVDCFWLVCRGKKLFDSKWVDIEIFLKIKDIVTARVLEVYPSGFVFYGFHVYFL